MSLIPLHYGVERTTKALVRGLRHLDLGQHRSWQRCITCGIMPLGLTHHLRRMKTTEAATERFRRAVEAIMEYNDVVPVPEMRWFISPAAVVDLVGGRPSDVKEYLLTRQAELDAHHQKFAPKITPRYNRHPMSITERVKMQEEPGELSYVSDDEQEKETTEIPC